MFGDDVSDEISREMLETVGFPVVLNKIAMWTVAVRHLLLDANPQSVCFCMLTMALITPRNPGQSDTKIRSGVLSPRGHHQFFMRDTRECTQRGPGAVLHLDRRTLRPRCVALHLFRVCAPDRSTAARLRRRPLVDCHSRLQFCHGLTRWV